METGKSRLARTLVATVGKRQEPQARWKKFSPCGFRRHSVRLRKTAGKRFNTSEDDEAALPFRLDDGRTEALARLERPLRERLRLGRLVAKRRSERLDRFVSLVDGDGGIGRQPFPHDGL